MLFIDYNKSKIVEDDIVLNKGVSADNYLRASVSNRA